ncbi:MAG: DUF721 domain-containing protein [Opitutales bacterium]
MSFSREAERLISSLRGLPSGGGVRVNQAPLPLDRLIEVTLKNHRIGEQRVEETIMRQWKSIVGEKWAERCSPVRLQNRRRLHVYAANSVVRNELLFRKREILARLRKLPGCEDIREVVFQQG